MSCLFPRCGNTKHFCKRTDVKFFRFPSIPFMREKWLQACELSECDLPKEPLICSGHFLEDEMATNKRLTRVSKSAVPKSLENPSEENVEYMDSEYLEECEENASDFEPLWISCKIVRNNYTSIATQTDDSLDTYQSKCFALESEIIRLKKNVVDLELRLSEAEKVKELRSSNQHTQLFSLSKPARYNLDDISSATCIYSAGPRCYRLLRKLQFSLPSPSTLRRWASRLCVEPGLQIQTLAHMKSFDLPLEEKLCVLSFDEMKCREEWAYDRKSDSILQPKRMVQVAMVRGLRGSWKQPIFYNFDVKMTQDVVFNIITEMYQIGFTVVATVSDLGPENQQLWRSMGIAAEKPFFKHPSDESKVVFVFADVPHLIKLLRNHFVDDGFLYGETFLTKKEIEELIGLCSSDLTITKTVSLETLNVRGAARQKVKHATKLFSHTTASALKRCATLGICKDAEKFVQCSELFQLFNDWFDVFNTRTAQKDTRPLSKAHGLAVVEQNSTLQAMSKIVPQLFPFRLSGKFLPFQRAILQNNNALPLLYKYVQEQYGMSFILTSKLNQDCLENFFSAIRAKGGLHDHPSALEFKYRLRSYLLGRNENMLCLEPNVEQTNDALIDFEDIEDDTLTQNVFRDKNDIPISAEEQMELTEQEEANDFLSQITALNDIEFDGLENFAGYIISKMGLTQFGCRTSDENPQNYTYVNLLSEGGLYKPNSAFLGILEEANSIFLKINGDLLTTAPKYMQNLLLNTNVDLDDKILKRFYLGRTFFRIRYLNYNLKQNKIRNVNKKMKKITT